MKFGICTVPVMPMRSEPSHKSEMVSQLLFGERIELHERVNDTWVRVTGRYDGYEGWCAITNVAQIEEALYQVKAPCLAADWVNKAIVNGHPMYLPLGSELPGIKSDRANWGRVTVEYKGNMLEPGKEPISDKLIRHFAYLYLNTAYLWGGKSPFGIDCSGFTQSVYRLLGKHLPRDAWQQVKEGEVVHFLQSARCGDLAFFDNDEGRITHTGILLQEFEIIHAAGKVRVDKIDGQGIINGDTGQRTHHLRMIKRFF